MLKCKHKWSVSKQLNSDVTGEHTHTRARAVGRYGVDRACTHTHTHAVGCQRANHRWNWADACTNGGTHSSLSPHTHTHTFNLTRFPLCIPHPLVTLSHPSFSVPLFPTCVPSHTLPPKTNNNTDCMCSLAVGARTHTHVPISPLSGSLLYELAEMYSCWPACAKTKPSSSRMLLFLDKARTEKTRVQRETSEKGLWTI